MNKLFWLLLLLLLAGPSQAKEIRQKIEDIHQQKVSISLERARLKEEVETLEKILADLTLKHAEKKENLKNHQEKIAKQLPLLVRLGRVNPLRILVDSTTSQNTLHGIVLVRALTTSLKRQMQQVQAELHEIAALSKETEEKAQSHLQLLQKIDLQQTQLSTVESQKIEDYRQSELDRLANEDDVNTLLEESRAALSQTKRTVTTATKEQGLPFRWLEHPVVGKIVQDPALQEKFSPHSQGIVFETQKNAEVSSPSKGTVVFKGPFQTQGEILILDHGEKVYTIFMGMYKIDAQVGQKVYTGERLGTMAGYGSALPKLYLELRQKGKAIDPQPYLIN